MSGLDVNSDADLNHGCTTESLVTMTYSPSLNVQSFHHDECSPNKNRPQRQESANIPDMKTETNITEILISSKRNLESKVADLQTQLSAWEDNYNIIFNNYKGATQKIQYLESELENLKSKFVAATRDLMIKDQSINDLIASNTKLCDENNNYQEQLEFTKTVLTAKEAENTSLHSQLYNLQNQFDCTVLQLQQLTNGSIGHLPDNNASLQQIELLKQKILDLEQQLKASQKERDVINSHYEHYTNELNEQLKSVSKKNEDLSKEIDNLSTRENNLIDQISDMEIRLQDYKMNTEKFDMKENSNVNDNGTAVADYNKLLNEFNTVQVNINYSIPSHII